MGRRTYKLRVEEVERLRREKCLTVEKLADTVGVDVRTVNRWLAGGELYAQSLGSLARALDTDTQGITDGEPLTPESNIVNVNLHFNISLSSIQRPENVKLLIHHLKSAIGAIGDIGIIGEPQEGSVILSLEMSEGDYRRLLKAFLQGKCDVINLTEITISPENEMLLPSPIFDEERLNFAEYSSQFIQLSSQTLREVRRQLPRLSSLRALSSSHWSGDFPAHSNYFAAKFGDRIVIIGVPKEAPKSPPHTTAD